MLGYVTVGTNDLARAKGFFDKVLAPLGGKQMIPTAHGVIYGAERPALGILGPHDGKPATVGNGTMVALVAATRDIVNEVHALALANGGADEGATGVRGPDPNGFYAGYFRDLDGNKFCVFRMGPA